MACVGEPVADPDVLNVLVADADGVGAPLGLGEAPWLAVPDGVGAALVDCERVPDPTCDLDCVGVSICVRVAA